ncbi:hypothetical protein GIB67_002670 [Kingdonia uniflora]|uniref:Uncharacterized protein n=1 Tax=Kingdonia uniflora TaxID=39325 RepID=A0A7J7LJG8_9MAGN|nr:hypothetical protein GIB67_002670 [Kingdonia uniflora]
MISRKNVNMAIFKCLGYMKSTKISPEKVHDLVAIVDVLREVQDITISIFESLLTFISRSQIHKKSNGWSLISKLMHTRHAAHNCEEAEFSEMEKADVALTLHPTNHVKALKSKMCKSS